MRRPCNKCRGGMDKLTGRRLYCTRCNSTGVMDRVTKAEKRRRRLVRRDGVVLPR